MAAKFRPNLHVFPNSPYAAELQRGAASRSFAAEVEAEYVRAHLLDNRTLIRVACAFAVVIAGLRGAEQPSVRYLEPGQLILVALVLTASVALAAIAWTAAFERLYLPLAQVVVPIRNALATVGIARVGGEAASSSC